MYRKMYEELVNWKNKSDRRPLLLEGMRQTGKTWLLEEFGKNEFENVACFDFEKVEDLASIFDGDLNPERILQDLEALFYDGKIIPGKTLVIFDEIQQCTRALTSLKYFYQEMPGLHVAAAGSLLGVALKRRKTSFPVGKVDRMELLPMSFEEFVIADGKESLLNSIKQMPLDQPLPAAYQNAMKREYQAYLITGGMPDAVEAWSETHDFSRVEAVQDRLLKDITADFSKYASASDIPKIGWIWDSVPSQLARENSKFIFSHVKPGKRSKDLEDALQWLINAGLTCRHKLITNPQLPLQEPADDSPFKLYLSDVGLLRRKANLDYRTILANPDEYDNFKGALTENFVLNELRQLGIHSYYWKSRNTAELDFVFSCGNNIIPVEAKADQHTHAKSYTAYCKKYSSRIGFKFSLKNIGENTVQSTQTWSLPNYLIWRLPEYLKMGVLNERYLVYAE